MDENKDEKRNGRIGASVCIRRCCSDSGLGYLPQRTDTLLPEMLKAAGVTEELKARDQMAWVGLMNNCIARAEEIILADLIYV